MYLSTWISVPKALLQFANEQSSRPALKIIGTYLYILDKTNWKPNTIRWNGGKTDLLPGQCFFSLTKLAEHIDCSKPTAKGYVKLIAEQFDLSIQTSNHTTSGGVIATWKNWEEISKPWKKFYAEKDLTAGLQQVNAEPPMHQDFEPYQFPAGLQQVSPSKEIINKNINLNLSHSVNDQKTLTQVSGESELELINIFKELFGLPVTKRESEKFIAAVTHEGWDDKQLEDWMKKIASDKLLKSLIWSINGIFHFSERLKDLNKIKTAVPAILERYNGTYESLDIKAFEDLISEAYETVKNYILTFPKRTRFNWNIEDFKNYFKSDISAALQGFEVNQKRVDSWKNKPQPSNETIELFDDIPDLEVTVERPRNLASVNQTSSVNPNQNDNLEKPKLTKEVVKTVLQSCSRESELDKQIQTIMENYETPEQLNTPDAFKTHYSEEIEDIAKLKNLEARESHEKFLEMRAEFIKLCKDSKRFPDRPLRLPYPSYQTSDSSKLSEDFKEAI